MIGHVAYFNCLFEYEGLQAVTASHIYCKCGNMSETVKDKVVATADH